MVAIKATLITVAEKWISAIQDALKKSVGRGRVANRVASLLHPSHRCLLLITRELRRGWLRKGNSTHTPTSHVFVARNPLFNQFLRLSNRIQELLEAAIGMVELILSDLLAVVGAVGERLDQKGFENHLVQLHAPAVLLV